MQFRGVEIDQRKLYIIASIAFGIIATMNTATLLQTYKALLTTQLLSQIGSLVLNYAFWGFFIHLYRTLPPKIEDVASDDELESILNQAVSEKKVLEDE